MGQGAVEVDLVLCGNRMILRNLAILPRGLVAWDVVVISIALPEYRMTRYKRLLRTFELFLDTDCTWVVGSEHLLPRTHEASQHFRGFGVLFD